MPDPNFKGTPLFNATVALHSACWKLDQITQLPQLQTHCSCFL